MKKLYELTESVEILSSEGGSSIAIAGITMDSRQVGKDYLFAAVRGTAVDGHRFIDSAIEKGAVAVICEEYPAELKKDVTYIRVARASAALAIAAANFYGNPSHELNLVGVTGTNGKTTVATLLYELYSTLGYKCGLVSTVQNLIAGKALNATHTTPDAVSLSKLIREMADAGCDYVFMECSSHAIDQDRIKGQRFVGAIFTNLTHDHLDYHKTFDAYLKAKKKFFDELPADAFALTNRDDRNGMVMLQNCKASKYSYSLHAASDFKAKIIECDFNGMLLSIDGNEAWYHFVGKFNASNLLAVYSTAFLLGTSKDEIIKALTTLRSVKGRFDFRVSDSGIVSIVDYAHTPDALKNILASINEIRTRNEQLITLVGCGGDRDKSKRPIMAEVACELSDKVIFTSDNPRSEKPEDIIRDMQAGVSAIQYKKTLSITDRREAIKAAVSMASKGDIILVAGKGHETYQEIEGVKYPFDDRAVLNEMFILLNK